MSLSTNIFFNVHTNTILCYIFTESLYVCAWICAPPGSITLLIDIYRYICGFILYFFERRNIFSKHIYIYFDFVFNLYKTKYLCVH